MKNSTRRRGAGAAHRINHAIFETLEGRKMLSAPVVLDPLPRNQRADYVTAYQDESSWPAPGHFEWEYTRQGIMYRFDQPTDVGRDDLILTRLNNGALIAANAVQETASGLAASESFIFPDTSEQSAMFALDNGNYEAMLRAGGPVNAGGEGMVNEHRTVFYVLAGDSDGNRVVNGEDYFAIDSNLISQFDGFVNGNLNYNRIDEENSVLVDGGDYWIIDAHMGTTMPEAPAAPNTLIAYASMGRGRIDINWTAPVI